MIHRKLKTHFSKYKNYTLWGALWCGIVYQYIDIKNRTSCLNCLKLLKRKTNDAPLCF